MMKFLISFIDGKNIILKKEIIEIMMQNDGYISNKRKMYNNCGLRYKYGLEENCDVPITASSNTVVFSGFTGPTFLIDFNNSIIILIMSNICHNSINSPKSIERKQLLNEIYNYII